jgi:lysozyme family protein
MPMEKLMVTCYLRYVVNPLKLAEFEVYAKKWLSLVEKFGGIHHGYFLPVEGERNLALSLFSFSTLAAYEDYRKKTATDEQCMEAMQYYRDTKCFLSFERSFFRPVLR